jgi:hypothetical protein
MRLKQGVKRMLDALAYQDAGDYLSYRAKLGVLGVSEVHKPASGPVRASNRVALLTDGDDEALGYALEICSHQSATLDVVVHGEALTDARRMQKLRASVVGIPHQAIHLPGETLSALADYVNNQSNLLYLVSSVSNPLARSISQRETGSHRLRTPVVLFDARRELKECTV